MTLFAFGNFKISDNSPWDEDVNQSKYLENSLDGMVNHYGEASFPEGPEYSMEYYRDSSLNTVAYILIQQNGAKTTKYYSLRIESGKLKDQWFYLGSEDTAAVKPGF